MNINLNEKLIQLIINLLNEMGIKNNLYIYEAVVDAIAITSKDLRMTYRINSNLYKRLGDKYHMTTYNVERNMRYFIKQLWEHGNKTALNNYFDNTFILRRDIQTNREFIATLAGIIREKTS